MSEDNIIIIGGGFSGIAMGCQLQRLLNFTNFEIYEKGSEFGGTWYFNTYPGCGCDIPSHFYSFSFEKNPDWSQVFPLQPEIQEYILRVCKKYNLHSHAHFSTKCTGAQWDNTIERWKVSFQDLKTKEEYTKTCKFLINCCGGLSIPNPCPVPGLENFKGQAWHSGVWNHNVDLTNKDVVVIGNGCSAAQFVPVILPQVKTLTQFIRSQHWIFERPNWKFSKSFKWCMRYLPGAMWFHRFILAFLFDLQILMFKRESGQWLRKLSAKGARKYMMSKSPEKYHDLLIPKFEVGTKRRIFDADYIECLNDPKILLTDDPLVQIQQNSVLTKSGKEYHADVIVYANGFQVQDMGTQIPVIGKNGESLGDRWRRQGGMRSYMGTSVANFPNMFLMVGPNVASGHYSILFMAECNVNYAIKLMEPFLGTGKQGSIEVTEEAEKKYVEWIQKRLKMYIWGNKEDSGWYLDPRTGHNGTVYPHFQSHYWLKSLIPKWRDYALRGNKPLKNPVRKVFFILMMLIMIVFSWLLSKRKK